MASERAAGAATVLHRGWKRRRGDAANQRFSRTGANHAGSIPERKQRYLPQPGCGRVNRKLKSENRMEEANGDDAADVGAESGHVKVAPLVLVAAAFRGGRFGVRSDPVGPLLLTKPYRPTIRTIALFTRTLGPNRLRGRHYRSP